MFARAIAQGFNKTRGEVCGRHADALIAFGPSQQTGRILAVIATDGAEPSTILALPARSAFKQRPRIVARYARRCCLPMIGSLSLVDNLQFESTYASFYSLRSHSL